MKLTDFDMRSFIADVYWYQARALIKLGQMEEARQALRDGRAAAERVGSRRSLWHVVALTSVLDARLGNAAEAEQERAEALELIHAFAATTPERWRETFMELAKRELEIPLE